MHHVRGRPDRQIDTVLGAHHPDVGDEVLPAPPQGGNGLLALQALVVGTGPHHRHVGAGLAPSTHRDLGVGLVGRHDVVGRPKRRSLQAQQPSVRQRAAVGEAGLVQLRAKIVVVEDEPRPVEAAEQPGDRPEDVGRVARLQHGERAGAAGPKHLRGRGQEGVRVLQDEADGPAPGCVRAVLQHRDALEDLVARVALPLRADDGDVVTRCGQRPALQPDPTVERDRQVLDDDQDPRSGISWVPAGHTTHPIPS